MSDKYHYDHRGNYVGHTSNRPPQPVVIPIEYIFVGLLLLGGYFLWVAVESWHLLDSPYKQVAFFYNYTIVVFLKSLYSTFIGLLYNELTPFENLNFIIGIPLSIFGTLIYYSIVFAVLKEVSNSLKVSLQDVFSLYALPGLFVFIWWVISSFLGWLFS